MKTSVILQIIFLSFVVADISYVLSRSKLFLGFRVRLFSKTIPTVRNPYKNEGSSFKSHEFKRKLYIKLHSLISCGFCLGHWVALMFVLIFGCNAFTQVGVAMGHPLFDYIATTFIVAWLAGIQWVLFVVLMNKFERG